jgi:tetratricopeptide (TPR) repeat protein
MPLFFREEKEISVKGSCAEHENAHLPAVVPSNVLKEEVVPVVEQSRALDSLEEVPTTPPEVVPSRKKRPFNWLLAGSYALLLSPLVVLLFRMATDEFTREFVYARAHWIMRDNSGAISYFSRALGERQDIRALEARADCYEAIGDLENERDDLRSLIQLTDLKKMPNYWSTYSPYSRLATLEARLGDLGNAVSLYELYATFPIDAKAKRPSYYEKEAAYELLLLGNISESELLLSKVATQERAEKPDLLSQVAGTDDAAFRHVLQALIYREKGDKVRGLDEIRSIGDKYVDAFRDSRFRYDCKNVVVSWCLEALICLDDRNTEKARSLIKLAESEKSRDNMSQPTLDVLKGWLLLEEGRLDDCLKLTGTTLAADKELVKSIDGLNMKAALHLIRKNVFLRQNLPEQAAHEDELYKQTHVSGRIFTPIPFRPNP